MSTLINFVFVFLGSFVFSFILWKRLKEDYANENIFSLCWIFLLSGLLGYWVGGFVEDLRFWISLLFALVFGFLAVKKMDFKLFEFTDALAPAWFGFLFFSALGQLLSSSSYISFPAFNLVITGVSLFWYIFFLKKYRTFSWYPSGRVGFPGLASLGLYLAFRSVAIYLTFMLPFFYNQELSIFEVVDIGISLASALSLWVILYLRSGRNLANKINI